jgi:hypothetical protein
MLDCQTPRGKKAIEFQHETQRILEKLGYVCVVTSGEDNYSDVILARFKEGLLTIYGIAEIKSRYKAGDQILTLDYLEKNGGYLITYDKIRKGIETAEAMKTAFFVIVRLLGDNDKILVWKIWDDGYLIPIINKKTRTQKTINGGHVDRINTFLPIKKAKIIE